MTQEEIKAKMQEGFAKIKPKVAEMTSIIMDAYEEGFNTCFELLTKPITATETKTPKFKIGDWVVDEEDNHVYQVKRVVTYVSSGMSGYDLSDGGYFYSTKTNCHLWSIADAKDGDVLAEESCIFIIRKLADNNTAAKTYCALYNDGDFEDDTILYFDIDSTKPATREQQKLLFEKMAEEGYEWDAEKKELSHKEVTKKSENEWEYLDRAYQNLIFEACDKYFVGDTTIPEEIRNWFRSFKQRVQHQPKWSEEDENNLRNAIVIIDRYRMETQYAGIKKACNHCLDWLSRVKQRLS